VLLRKLLRRTNLSEKYLFAPISPLQNTRKISYLSASSIEESLFPGLKYHGTLSSETKCNTPADLISAG
jgi:hypothetical protein